MSDILEIVIEENDLELSSDDSSELLFSDDGLELTVIADAELIITDDVVELLTDSEPGIPSGGLVGQVLAKKSGTSFDVEWVSNVKITVGMTPPMSPSIGDLWVDTN